MEISFGIMLARRGGKDPGPRRTTEEERKERELDPGAGTLSGGR
jgi:hypothetical protein